MVVLFHLYLVPWHSRGQLYVPKSNIYFDNFMTVNGPIIN